MYITSNINSRKIHIYCIKKSFFFFAESLYSQPTCKSLCEPDWPRSHRDSPVSASLELRLKAHVTMPGKSYSAYETITRSTEQI